MYLLRRPALAGRAGGKVRIQKESQVFKHREIESTDGTTTSTLTLLGEE